MAKSDFYGDEESDIPSVSNYMKFEEGDNRFRILGSFREKTAIQGMVYWTTVDGKRTPKRVRRGVAIPVEELEENRFGEIDRPKFFWTFPVWNYQEKKIQILEINQATVLRYIKKVIDNPKWGDPRDYDFIVTRTESSGKTTYTLTNDPKEKLDSKIIDQFLALNLNLEALYEGGDPFKGKEEAVDPDEADDALSGK